MLLRVVVFVVEGPAGSGTAAYLRHVPNFWHFCFVTSSLSDLVAHNNKLWIIILIR